MLALKNSFEDLVSKTGFKTVFWGVTGPKKGLQIIPGYKPSCSDFGNNKG